MIISLLEPALGKARIKTEKEDGEREKTPEDVTSDKDQDEDLDASDDLEDCVGDYWSKAVDFRKNQVLCEFFSVIL